MAFSSISSRNLTRLTSALQDTRPGVTKEVVASANEKLANPVTDSNVSEFISSIKGEAAHSGTPVEQELLRAIDEISSSQAIPGTAASHSGARPSEVSPAQEA